MDDLLDRLRVQVERAADPIDPGEVRAARLPGRARLLNVAAVAVLLAIVIGLVALRPGAGEQAADQPVPTPPAPTNLGLSALRFEVRGAGEATEVRIVFDGDLPVGEAVHVADITSVEDPGLSFTTQSMEGNVWQCASRHWDFGPGAVGRSTVDVLVPSRWVAPDGVQARDGRVTYIDPRSVGKIMACGPYKGYVQYSITAPPFDGADDVSVRVDGRSIRVVIEAPGA